MEKSGKKTGGFKVPRRNRSLDIKSLYKSRVSKVEEKKGKVFQENGQQNVKKRRRSKKEVSLSQFEPDAKKSKKEDATAVEEELESSPKPSGVVEGLHGISLSSSENGNAFNFPKRPRGTMGRKKLVIDKILKPLGLTETGDHEGAFNAGVKGDAGTSGELVRLDDVSASNDGVSRSKSEGKVVSAKSKSAGKAARSNSKSAGKVGNSKSKSSGQVGRSNSIAPAEVGQSDPKSQGKVACSNSKLKQKADSKSASKAISSNLKLNLKGDSKSTGKVICSNVKLNLKAVSKSTGKVISSNVKLKRKVEADEITESRDGGSGPIAKENVVAVNSGDTSSKKRRPNSRKKKESVDGKDGKGASKKKSKPSIGSAVSFRIVADYDGDKEEENFEQRRRKEDIVAVNSGDASKKRRTNFKKQKDLVDGKNGGDASKKFEPSVGMAVSDKIVADFDGDEEENLEQNGRKESCLAVNSEDTSSKKRQTNIKKKKDLANGEDGAEASTKFNPSVGGALAEKIVADSGEVEGTLEQCGAKENDIAVNSGDTSSRKRRTNDTKKKDLVDGKDGEEATNRKSKPSIDGSVSEKIVTHFSEDDKAEENIEQIGGEDNVAALNCGDTASMKRQINSRKKKDLIDGKDGAEASNKKSEPSVGISVSNKGVADSDEDDDDEENLEQNAARMLSSRFDPSCTGFPSKRKSSAFQKANESSFPVPSTLDSFSQHANSSGGVDSALIGDDSRALRPRREDSGKGVPRRRRHFYEIPPKDLEPNFVLNRRIKVFWPLDESWYFGLVNDYHPECRLYHIKYDDRDEEWVDLNEEMFKLLLYPSEVPGRDKSKKLSRVQKDVHQTETIPPEDGDNSMETDLDSEPIASWLARSSQRGKSSKTPGSSRIELTIAKSKERNDVDCGFASPYDLLINEDAKSLVGALNGTHLVYARKKSQTGGEGSGLVSRYAKAFGSASGAVDPVDPISVTFPTTGEVDSEKQIWSIDHQGKLWLNVRLMESKRFRFRIRLPSLPCWGYSLQTADSSLLHDVFMVQHGVLLPTSSAVMLEMLLIDNHRGLRFFSFEGCKKQAMVFVFEILIFFSQADELMERGMQSPVTSIRFSLSGVRDLRKCHAFEFHCFSEVQSSKWAFLGSKLLKHCLLKQLPASECTYDNIQELEYWSLKQCAPQVGLQLLSHVRGLNEGVSKEAYGKRTSQSAFYLSVKPGELRTFVLFSSAAPTSLLTQHLHLLMENSSAKHPCQHDVHEQIAESLPDAVISIPSQAFDHGSKSRSAVIVDISSSEQGGVTPDGKESMSRQASDVAQSVNECFNQNNPTGAKSSLQGTKISSFPTPANRYPMWTDRTPQFMRRGFSTGPKRPRSQVQYALPGADSDFGVKQKAQNQRSLPGKRVRRESLKRISDSPRSNQKNFEFIVCDANVLVTRGDKGWRECGALIVLEVAEHNEWRLAVKLSGITKYSYKVNHILQPGSTNRYSHAVLWKGGKDWILEFTDRSQWNIFKEMHEECYNRNVRAASVKNIPIPGVQPIDECDDYYGTELPFVRNPTKFLRQLQTDVEMAMDPSHVLYDMDSDDEQWLMSNQECGSENGFDEISDEILEKTMDIFEKASYVKHRDNFNNEELRDFVAGMGSVEAAKLIYEHWRGKRARKGMPLIRHLQPPLWERYQQQLRDWENAIARDNSANSVGAQGKARVPEKPAMFAFCLKPRGLDVRNKSFKQRSHRKYPVSGHLHSVSANRENFYSHGKKSNGQTYGGMNEPSGVSALPPSMRRLSPRDAHSTLSAAVSVASASPRVVYGTNQKKHGRHPSSDTQQTAPNRRRKVGRKTGVQQRNMGLPDSSSQMDFYSEGPERQGVENMDDSDLNGCHFFDASAAARHALELAKLKREKARILFNKAEVAIQRAVAAIMTADAIKASCESANGSS